MKDYRDECDLDIMDQCPQHEQMTVSISRGSDDPDESRNTASAKTSRPLSRMLSFLGASALLVVVALVCLGSISQAHLRQVEREREELLDTQQRLLLQLAKDKRKTPASEEEGEDLIKHVETLQQRLEATSSALEAERIKLGSVQSQTNDAWEDVTHMTTQLSMAEAQMHQDQASMYHTLALQQFGEGPHQAEFKVKIWNGEVAQDETFKIEFAPLDYMPSTVYLLLRQISQGLWDNTSFHINAPHVMLAHPVSAADSNVSNMDEMQKQGLARLPFAEYSERYPHHAYTLGLGGRVLPGPNFFINKIDNSDNHMDQPCFAKIISGHETIDAMGQLTGQEGSDPYYIQPVEIQSVRILSAQR